MSDKPSKQKGGKRFGGGAYGVVFGEPRLRCTDEEYDLSLYDIQVSKHFLNKKDMINEYNSVYNFVNSLSEGDKNIISKTTILPLTYCNENLLLVGKGVYNKEWGSVDLIKFIRDKRGTNKSFPMIIYPKAEHSLDEEITTHMKNIDDGISILENIAKAIVVFHKNKYTHRDIKTQNCVVKIDKESGIKSSAVIDMADIQKFKIGTKPGGLPLYFPYYIWPSAILFLHSKKKNTYNICDYINHEEFKGHINTVSKRFKNLYRGINDLVPDEHKEIYKAKLIRLYFQKMFVDISIEEIIDKIVRNTEEDKQFMETPLKSFNKICKYEYERVKTFVDRFNGMTDEDKSLYINSFTDIYSFGVIIQETLEKCYTRKLITEEADKDLWIRSLDIAYECMNLDDITIPDKPFRMYYNFMEKLGYSTIPGVIEDDESEDMYFDFASSSSSEAAAASAAAPKIVLKIPEPDIKPGYKIKRRKPRAKSEQDKDVIKTLDRLKNRESRKSRRARDDDDKSPKRFKYTRGRKKRNKKTRRKQRQNKKK